MCGTGILPVSCLFSGGQDAHSIFSGGQDAHSIPIQREDSAHLTQLLVGKNPLVLLTIIEPIILPTLLNNWWAKTLWCLSQL
ncbi:hypothetical protein LYNGBM3L_32330 [Moorena producens 3L]|uniref:Uncharacterized protein n=1 Tax=Moorena producens 3L TaxID=489825 RepID=F4XTR9_9CYAN|nr:hypothetical protein LYNGBM3L_32330 [Moorena producens 3L]